LVTVKFKIWLVALAFMSFGSTLELKAILKTGKTKIKITIIAKNIRENKLIFPNKPFLFKKTPRNYLKRPAYKIFFNRKPLFFKKTYLINEKGCFVSLERRISKNW